MDLYGLIGKSLKHSFSGEYFGDKFEKEQIDAIYHLFEMEDVPDLHEFLEKNPRLKGLNVTIPYKRMLIQQMDDLSPVAETVGGINVVDVCRRNGKAKLVGHNTDVFGIEQSLKPLIKKREQLRALILGTGGGAHAVAYVLRKWGIYYYYVSRTPKKLIELNYTWLTPKLMQEYELIINTTPLGMHPNEDTYPDILYDKLTENHILFDLVYNPEETLFLKKGKEKGAKTKNGLEMLYVQAEESWKIWNKGKK
ncbi:MAG: shikimate dehydrogenase [Bacteroidales bacterium]|nr:shikimate dehydrogenase [Bacteroidales bacterium]